MGTWSSWGRRAETDERTDRFFEVNLVTAEVTFDLVCRTCQEGWVKALGVRRPHRKQGLGQALLLTGMKALQDEGMQWAMLDVGTENLTGALRLYEGVGFRPAKRAAAFGKVIRV